MSMIPKNMDEFLQLAKDVSVKAASTISKLCESYVAKVGAEGKPTENAATEQTKSNSEEQPK